MCDQYAYTAFVGPSLSMRGSYADRVKLLHTMEPANSAFTRMHPTPTNQVAVQQLNEQGLYPVGNNRADFQGGQYPAPIEVRPRAAGDAPADCPQFMRYGRGCGDRGVPVRSCTACCPGQNAPSVRDIVAARPTCVGECARTGEWPACAMPASADALAAVGRQEARSYAMQRCLTLSNDPYAKADYRVPSSCLPTGGCRCGAPRGGCSACRGRLPYPYAAERPVAPETNGAPVEDEVDVAVAEQS